jgi:hypothetical protein
VQCLPEEAVEDRPRHTRPVCGAHLAEDFALPGHQRVEPCGNAAEMQGGSLVTQAIERGPEL